MPELVLVSPAQVVAAKAVVSRRVSTGRPVSEALQRIAEARHQSGPTRHPGDLVESAASDVNVDTELDAGLKDGTREELPGGPSDVDLIADATAGDASAWEALMVRYTPLVRSVTSQHHLSDEDAADVSQTVWMRFVEQLPQVASEPAALSGWISTTARVESARKIRRLRHGSSEPPGSYDQLADPPSDEGDLADPLTEEYREAMAVAFAELSDIDRRLLTTLFADPPLTPAQISERLNIPIGSIGPTRRRVLMRIRRSVAQRSSR